MNAGTALVAFLTSRLEPDNDIDEDEDDEDEDDGFDPDDDEDDPDSYEDEEEPETWQVSALSPADHGGCESPKGRRNLTFRPLTA